MSSSNRTNHFDVMSTARYAWSKVYGCKAPIGLAVIACMFMQLILGFIKSLLAAWMEPVVANILINLIGFFVLMPAYVGLMYMGLQRVRGLPVLFNQILYPYRKDLLIQVWLFYLCLYGICIFFLALIFASLYLSIPFLSTILMFALFLALAYFVTRVSIGIYLVLDKNEKAITALKHAYWLTGPYVWKLIFAYSLILISMILGCLTLMIGLIWAIPFTYIFTGAIYQKISGESVIK